MELRKLLYRYDEAAELLSLSKQSIRRLVDAGDLERVYVAGREPRITQESIAGYVKRKKQQNGTLVHPT